VSLIPLVTCYTHYIPPRGHVSCLPLITSPPGAALSPQNSPLTAIFSVDAACSPLPVYTRIIPYNLYSSAHWTFQSLKYTPERHILSFFATLYPPGCHNFTYISLYRPHVFTISTGLFSLPKLVLTSPSIIPVPLEPVGNQFSPFPSTPQWSNILGQPPFPHTTSLPSIMDASLTETTTPTSGFDYCLSAICLQSSKGITRVSNFSPDFVGFYSTNHLKYQSLIVNYTVISSLNTRCE
jgi:hypothetical protein